DLVTGVQTCALPILVAAGCGGGGHTVLVAPRLNLLPYGSVGLVTFSIEKAKGSLNEFATRRFEEYVLAAQSGIEVQEFSLPDSRSEERRVGKQCSAT